MNQPKSLAEAKAHVYGKWAGCSGHKYDPKRCACHTMTGGRGSLPTQCWRKPGSGPDGIYCANHAEEFFPAASETWWSASASFNAKIEEVQVSKSSDRFIWIVNAGRSRKSAICNDWQHYFPTKQQAIDFLIQRFNAEIEKAKRSIEHAESAIAELSKP